MAEEQAGPFEPDPYTLLLAHFEESPWHADYAMGWDRFGGNGATLVDGYYGKAADLRGIQFSPDYAERGTGYTPFFSQWNFWPKGNVTYDQGTLEFWFQVASDKEKPNLIGRDLLFFYWYQPLRPQIAADFPETGLPQLEEMRVAREMGKMRHIQPYIRLAQNRLAWQLVTRGGEVIEGDIRFKDVKGFAKILNTNDWHHFAMTWDDRELVIYLDGRPMAAYNIEGQHGLALTSINQRPIAINNVVLDEFRISSVVRYKGSFEPRWREGVRPQYAFTGMEGITVAAGKAGERTLSTVFTTASADETVAFSWGDHRLVFDRKTGYLVDRQGEEVVAEGMRLWNGVEREPLTDVEKVEWNSTGPDVLEFSQYYPNGLVLEHQLHTGKHGELLWDVAFINQGDEQLWLEALMGIPAPWEKVDAYFDGSWEQTDLRFPRRRDEYVYTLPFAAIASGEESLGVGIDPHIGLSSLVSEYVPTKEGGVLRQGTRVVLDPGQRYELPFRLVDAKGKFGVKDALVAYHELSPDLYRLREDVPVYSYMPVSQHFLRYSIPDLARKLYIGSQWGHGPYHTKGDYMGTPKYWNNPKLLGRVDYRHARSHSQLHGTIANMRQEILERSRSAYNNFYTIRRSHDVPNLTATFIVEDLWPEFDDRDDPMVAGQYYLPSAIFTNEYKTPLGDKFKEDMANTIRLIGRYSPGFINDMSQISPYRFVDEIARKQPGRAFAEDRGVYLISAFGHMDRYKMINSFLDNGFRQSIWSDFGQVSYMLSAHSSSNAFEAGEQFTGPSQMEWGLTVSRNLLGEKPIAGLVSYGADQIGRLFSPDDFTPESLRDFYRYSSRGIMLLATKVGYYLDPPYLHGRQWMTENQPVLVQTLVNGRKTVPGGRVAEPLWLRRGGDGWNTFLVVGNETPSEHSAELVLYDQYFGDAAAILVPYFGGVISQRFSDGETTVDDLSVPARDMVGFRQVASLHYGAGSGRATADLAGDGIEMELQLHLELREPGVLSINDFAPIYKVTAIEVDGQPQQWVSEYKLSPGKHRVRVRYHAEAFQFDAATWAGVDLLNEKGANFAIIGENRPGYAHGNALQFVHFIEQYDEEDGVVGTMAFPKIVSDPSGIDANFSGWVIDLRPDRLAGRGQVTIDPERRRIEFHGRTHGEIRRALVLFLRLMDRKYPAVGRIFPLRRDLSKGWEAIHRGQGYIVPWNDQTPFHELWIKEKATKAFYGDFSDPEFLQKPILEPEYESLYKDGNLDFQGRYELRFAPYIFEPTYDDDYVYGYSGSGVDEVIDELHQTEYRGGNG